MAILRMFGGIAATCGRRAERTLALRDCADRLKPNFAFSKRDSYQRRGHLTVCKVASYRLTLHRTRQGGPRNSREVALARTSVQRRRPRAFGRTFDAVLHKPNARSVSDRPACAVRVARDILEPRAPSDEHRIVTTSLLPRRFHTMHRHAFVPVAH